MNRTKDKTSYGPHVVIKVVGVGGGGGNAASRMCKDFLRGVEFLAINTDQQDLDQCHVKRKIHIGSNLTRGMGAGMNPDIGRQAAEENRSEIAEALRDADIVFIAAGLGGGTGSGTSPVVAEIAKQLGALTIAVVTKPFTFEGTQRERIAAEAIVKLKDKVDALIVVPNDRIFSIISKDTPLLKAFQAIDEILKNSLKGIAEMILTPGIINVDFSDVQTVIKDSGSAIVGIGIAAGPDRAISAVNQALNSPLLEVSAEGAHGVLLGISGGRDMRMTEINEAAKLVAQTVDPAAKIIFGAYQDKTLKPNQIKVTLIATGFSQNNSSASGLFAGAGTGFLSGSSAASSKSEVRSAATSYQADEESQEEDSSDYTSADFEKSLPRQTSAPTRPSGAGINDTRPVAPARDDNQKKKEKDNDIWDIPTFLRRRK